MEDKSSYQTTFIGEGAVAAHKNITSNCLPENLYPKNISNHLLGFLIERQYMSTVEKAS